MKKNVTLITLIVAIIITSIFMMVFITKKNGWHEDEIFSYGSSNYKYDNLLVRFADKDSLNQLIDEKIIDSSPLKTIQNIGYYLTHQNEFMDALNEKVEQELPIWKTSEQAKDYMVVSSDEIFNYWSVYYNQSRDVHPPLFYMLVHFVSSLCVNHFSKYIIFTINLVFYILSCFVIHKIMKLLNKDNLSAIVVLLYGLSMGAISIVMFQRMYVMLTFFILLYLYMNLKICKNSFEIDKKTKRNLTLTVILGFLTQYYFCIFAVILAIVMGCGMLKNRKFAELKQYIWCHVKAAIIGIVIFPASIYHIFFSYRGVAGGVVDASYIERLNEYLKIIFYAFSMPEKLGYIIIGILVVLLIYKLIKGKRKNIISIITIPIILYTLIIAKISPYINIRYIAPVFPIICIAIVLAVVSIIKQIITYVTKNSVKSKVENFLLKYAGVIVICIITISVSAYGLIKSEPQFLYEDYKDRIELADKYQNLKLVYIGEVKFNYLQDMEEFLRYHEFIICSTWELNVLKDNEGLKDEKEFILNVKCWISDYEKNLNKVLEYTDAIDYELLLADGQSRVYKVTRANE